MLSGAMDRDTDCSRLAEQQTSQTRRKPPPSSKSVSKQPPQRKSKRNVKESGDSAYETPSNYSDPTSNEALYNYSIRRDQPLDSHDTHQTFTDERITEESEASDNDNPTETDDTVILSQVPPLEEIAHSAVNLTPSDIMSAPFTAPISHTTISLPPQQNLMTQQPPLPNTVPTAFAPATYASTGTDLTMKLTLL